MKFWITRDKSGELQLWEIKPRRCGDDGDYFIGGKRKGELHPALFPEITFENSPQQVELKLKL